MLFYLKSVLQCIQIRRGFCSFLTEILTAIQKHISFLFSHASFTYKLRLLSTNLYCLLNIFKKNNREQCIQSTLKDNINHRNCRKPVILQEKGDENPNWGSNSKNVKKAEEKSLLEGTELVDSLDLSDRRRLIKEDWPWSTSGGRC